MLKHVISQLGHVELLTPKLEESAAFFTEVLGMTEVARQSDSVHLRAWGEPLRTSLKLTDSPQSGLGHAGWRADSAEALQEAVRFLGSSGAGEGWIDGDIGHGPAYRYRTPDGHLTEIYWETEWYEAPEGLRSTLKNRSQKFTGKGAAVRRLDHLTLSSSDVTACRKFSEELGFRHHEGIFADESGPEIGAWLSVTGRDHDTAFVLDATGTKGRLNHIAYWVDTPEMVMRAADILRDAEAKIEAGPSRHANTEGFFLYTCEPGGNRVEIFSGGYVNFTPDWGPTKWLLSEQPGTFWGGGLPESLFTMATPPVAVDVDAVPTES